MRLNDGMEKIKIKAPVPGACPQCATKHEADKPHDRNSLYYLYLFRKRNRRFPSWSDAMAHCDNKTKARWTQKLVSKGIPAEEFT